MGRPKVRPEARRRVVQACEPCKSSKRRCDARKPCGRCITFNRPGQCWFKDSNDGHESTPGRPLSDTPHDDANALQSPLDSASSLLSPGSGANDDDGTALDQSEVAYVPASSRMLRSEQGEMLHIGPSASLSFLQLLRNTFARHASASQSEQDGKSETMYEAESTPRANQNHTDLTNMQQLTEYVHNYFGATSGILNLFTKAEVLQSVQYLANPSSPELRQRAPAIYLIIAIGAQCGARNELDSRYAAAYFHAAYRAIPDLLLVPSINYTTVSLLMSFYMLAAYRRNAAYMYIGVAARAAHSLGLHHQSSYDTEDREALRRLSLWKSIYVLDLMVCSILGRPPAVAITDPSDQEVVARLDVPLDTCSVAFEAAFRAAKIIGEILNKMYREKAAGTLDAHHFLKRLTDWRLSLPAELRRTVDIPIQPLSEKSDREIAIASMNMACFYYYAVMLVSRPFLVSNSNSELRNQSGSPVLGKSSANDGLQSTGLDQLSRVCVDSAVYMIEAVYNTSQTGALLSNTCFIKAWVFAAALVLGFSMFTEPRTSFTIKNEFDLAMEFLHEESAISPYAKQYYGILKDMTAVIQKCHDQIAQQRRSSNKEYIDRLLDFRHDGSDMREPGQALTEDASTTSQDLSFDNENTGFFLSAWDDVIMDNLEARHPETQEFPWLDLISGDMNLDKV
ncbi:fungal-specific transcription factor domain-containing protein [Ilyonectria sp. MPI-CAGE-AT-0026]|nr:fungal-specific transcription factor domain-containing protein [Ilyonectria sp. MPI-CAGE-AT-0026]